ncbi:MAG TPA: NAD(P)H-hydrate dehydratase [Candidatus Acidoferrales bacterium]|nr:NAD(P)H-hydrate dehydratase [Candidatus Acidoferrales bacterium]
MKILTAEEMREVDRLTTERYGIPGLTLMENAGASVAQFIAQRWTNLAQRRIVVLCGKGNNGGDGFVAARHLRELGAKPEVYLFAAQEEMRGDAATNCKRWQEAYGELHVVRDSSAWQSAKSVLASAEVIVDALLGTGTRGALAGLLGEVVADVNGRRGPIRSAVVAVDIPSGLVADTGEANGPVVKAAHTVTFTAPKIGMTLGASSDHVGQLFVRDIGSPPELIEEVGKSNIRWIDARELSKFAVPRRADGNKGSYGHALIVAGSVGKSGAAVLASWAGLRVGAGLVTVATPEPVLPIVAAHTPEIMTEPLPATEAGTISMRSFEYERFDKLVKGKHALAIGPGLTTQDETQQFVHAVVERRSAPIVLDADGLNAFAGQAQELRNGNGPIALTPHPGEMARLLGCEIKNVQARRLEVARKSAADWNAFVILKGHQTVIASPDGQMFVNSTGNPGMGTGGTGDVLTGMLAGLTAQFGTNDWVRVLAFGVYLHGLAGDVAYAGAGEAPLLASDLIHAIPRAYQEFYSHA